MKVNSITTSNQGSKLTDRERDKNKDKYQPIMPYYVISNRLYSSHYNSPKNPKSFLHKKNYINNLKDINLNTKNNKKKIIKSNSTLSSYNNFNYNQYSKQNIYSTKHNKNEINSTDHSPTIKDKILSKSKKNSKSGNKTKNKKQINFDCNLLIKKISNPNKQKSMHDIFYNDNNNCFTLNTSEAMKKNKKMIMTSLNNSKNSSQEKGKIHSKKKTLKFNYIGSNIKLNVQEKNNGKKILSLNNSSKCITNKVQTTNNNNNNSSKIEKLNNKNHAKLISSDLYHPDNIKKGINFFMNYIKGVNNIASNSNSFKSINSTGNVTYKKPLIKSGINEYKNEYNYVSNQSSNKNTMNTMNQNASIKANKYNQNQKQNTARSLSINTKYDKKNNDFLSIFSFNSINKHSKKNSLNNTKVNLKKYLGQFGDSPFYKYCHKTTGNYIPKNNNSKKNKNKNNIDSSRKNYKTIKSPYNYNSKYSMKNNNGNGINPITINKKNIINENNKYVDNYSYKAEKIIKDSEQEISKIKSDFAKHFTGNNSPNPKGVINNKKNVDNNNNNRFNSGNNSKSKNNWNNNSIKNNMNVNGNRYSLKKKKKTSKHSSIKKDSISKIKHSPKKYNKKINKENIKQLTQNNSKLNIKKILEPKKENEIYRIKNMSITNQYNQSLTHSSRSGIHDSNYYLRESQKLSNYIKNYYIKNKKYPETNLKFYKYGRLIGQGAFGKVNLGLNILTGRVVAIKSFNKLNINSNSENMKKIKYETNLMKKLNHPNVTKILELFEDKDYILIIMEYLNGGNLFSFLKKRRKVSEKTAKFLFKQIMLGIQYIHSHNIVHRDIKLENILIDLNNNIKICDFGIGRVLTDPNQLLYDQCGTPMYIAPEILLSTNQKGYKGFPVDIWSSGIALYILLSGTLPFSIKNGKSISIEESEKNNDNSEELQFSIINNEPKDIENISSDAKDLLKGLLNKDPEKRLTCEQILSHPWLKGVNENVDSNKYHLFTKAEMTMLSKTYVDYRKDQNDNLKENFTLSNLFIDDKKGNSKNEKNEETKSSILAPFNSVNENNDYDDDFYDDDSIMDDFNNKNIHLENEIINIGNKVKEYNMLYEMNNNCEVDNGIIINSKTNTLTSNNNTICSLEDSFTERCGMLWKKEKQKEKEKEKEKDNDKKNKNNNKFLSTEVKKMIDEPNYNDKYNKNNDNIIQINNILNQIESLGYDKQYVQECIKNNILCHASTVYFLMLNYDKI